MLNRFQLLNYEYKIEKCAISEGKRKAVILVIKNYWNELNVYLPILYKIKELNSEIKILVIFDDASILEKENIVLNLWSRVQNVSDVIISKQKLGRRANVKINNKPSNNSASASLYKESNQPATLKLYVKTLCKKLGIYSKIGDLLIKIKKIFLLYDLEIKLSSIAKVAVDDAIAILKDNSTYETETLKYIQKKYDKARSFLYTHSTGITYIGNEEANDYSALGIKCDVILKGCKYSNIYNEKVDNVIQVGFACLDKWWVEKMNSLVIKKEKVNRRKIVAVFLPVETINNYVENNVNICEKYLHDIYQIIKEFSDAYFILKPHPRSMSMIKEVYFQVDNVLLESNCSSTELIYSSDLVITLPSSVEYEAIHLGKPVLEYLPFNIIGTNISCKLSEERYGTFYSCNNLVKPCFNFEELKADVFDFIKGSFVDELYKMNFNHMFKDYNDNASEHIAKIILKEELE